jgi:hypothetical protein
MSENNFNSENRNSDQTRVDGGNDFGFETEVITNESGKKAIRISKLSKKQKEVLMSSGVAFAGLTAGAGAFTMLSFTESPESIEDGEVQNEESNEESIVIEVDSPIASSSSASTGSISFNQAFADARAELGPGGLFVWEGDLYHTYTASEWNSMTNEERMEFSSSITVQNADGVSSTTSTHVTVENSAGDAASSSDTTASTNSDQSEDSDFDIVGYDLDNDGSADLYVFDIDENGVPDILIDSTGDGVFNQVIMNVDFESDQSIDSYESFDVEIYPEDLQDVEVISLDRGDQASNVTAQDDLIFDELADNDFDANFDNDSDVSDFI